MVFKADDAKSIARLKPGDKVRFRVKVVGDQPTLTRIELAKKWACAEPLPDRMRTLPEL